VDVLADDVLTVCAAAPQDDRIVEALTQGSTPFKGQNPPATVGVEVADILHVVGLAGGKAD
jgi:hypothetical protein